MTGASDLIAEHLAGAQVFEAQRVALVADGVDGVGEQVAIGGDAECAERKEVVAICFEVRIEQYLFIRDRRVRLERRGSPIGRIADRAPAAQRILLTLDGARVVPPLSMSGWHRHIGFLGAAPVSYTHLRAHETVL